MSLRIRLGLALFVVAVLIFGYAAYLEATHAANDEVRKYVDERIGNLNQTTFEGDDRELDLSMLPEDEKQIVVASDLYAEENYDKCLEVIGGIKTSSDKTLEKIHYYRIFARLRKLEGAADRMEPVSIEQMNVLEEDFKRFLEERKTSSLADDVRYWYGQFYLGLRKDETRALEIFDNIVNDYWYSNWIQGSLYYSAILYHKKPDSKSKDLAIARLKIILQRGGIIKLVPSGREVDAVEAARSLLSDWNVVIPKGAWEKIIFRIISFTSRRRTSRRFCPGCPR
jgi:hypothetical protein